MSINLHVSPESSTSVIHRAAQCIAEGGVLAVGTESFYALAGGALNAPAVTRVANLKGRSSRKPILALLGDVSQVPLLVESISPIAEEFMKRFWPGPITLVLPARTAIPEELTGGTHMVGVRVPNSGFLRSLLMQTGPLTGTSANRSGEPPACSASRVQEQFGNDLEVILDTGPAPGGRPSTLLEIGESIRLLRQGPVTRREIEEVLASQGLNVSIE